MLGDSITQGWEDEALPLWRRYFEPRKAINLGFSGDRTEQVLWRLQNGAADNISPGLVCLLIGTNNTGHRQDPPNETVAGIEAILGELRTRLPRSRILLHAVLPRGAEATDPERLINARINERIVGCTDNERIFFADFGHHFVDEDGQLRVDLMPDLLHLSLAGYRVWADNVVPLLDELTK